LLTLPAAGRAANSVTKALTCLPAAPAGERQAGSLGVRPRQYQSRWLPFPGSHLDSSNATEGGTVPLTLLWSALWVTGET